MKRLGINLGVIALVLVMAVGFVSCDNGGGGERAMTPGTFVTESRGYVDMIRVATTVDRSRILSVHILSHRETQAMGTFAADIMPGRIVATQSLMADVVTGATITSQAITRAVREALEDAGANMSRFERPVAALPPHDQTLDFNVVVVGAGSAGLAAAMAAQDWLSEGYTGIERLDRRRSVLLIEMLDVPGGNTIRSSGAFNVQTTEAGANNRLDQGLTGGHWINHRNLLQMQIWNSRHIAPWFRTRGMDTRTAAGGSVEGDARGLIMGKLNAFELWEGTVLYRVKAERILMSGGRAVGIEARDMRNGGTITINAEAVVLAAGGFGYNWDMMRYYGLPARVTVTNNSPASIGNVHYMARDVGARLIHMDFIQTHPTIHQASSTMLTEGIRGAGGILLNTLGQRFTNENGFRDVVSEDIFGEPEGRAALVFPYTNMSNTNVVGYRDIGLISPITSNADLAAVLGVPLDTLNETLADWAEATRVWVEDMTAAERTAWGAMTPEARIASGLNPLALGRSNFAPLNPGHSATISAAAPVFAVWIAPGVHYTMGGIMINELTEVIHSSANIAHLPTEPLAAAPGTWPVWPVGPTIPGLFAAGEITGGVHGGNRQGGNAITDILVFGRIAGYNAARFADGLPAQNPWPWSVGDSW